MTVGSEGEQKPRARVVLVDVRSERRAVMRVTVEHALGEGTVVGEVATAEAFDHHAADVAVVEIQLPLADGLAVIAALRAAHPLLRILVCSFHDDAATKRQARRAGVDGYLTKPVSSRELRRAFDSLTPAMSLAV